ncbi:MAG: signal peptidase I [Deltaproteobacteria bacterium]|nr:signal peptidase I [Deltaproteobacteria bacterium]
MRRVRAGKAGAGELFRELLEQGVTVRLRVTGGSMKPAIRSGDVVLVRPVNGRRIAPGDVVLFGDASGKMVLHRVEAVERKPGGTVLRTRGDAAVHPDLPVPLGQVWGVVETVLPRPWWWPVQRAAAGLISCPRPGRATAGPPRKRPSCPQKPA